MTAHLTGRIRESATRKKVKNSNKRMKTKGKYENRELFLIYSKMKTPSKELLQILKKRELTVNPFSSSKVGLVPAKPS